MIADNQKQKLDQQINGSTRRAWSLEQAHSQIFQDLDKIDIQKPEDNIKSLCTRFAIWRDTLQLAMDEATICLQLLKEQRSPINYKTVPIYVAVCQSFCDALKECGLDNADCFDFLNKFKKQKEQ
jgi:hypothetical protein